MNADLQQFVRESLARGIPRPTIVATLQQAGWRPEEIEAGLTAWAEADFPIPVPRRRPYLSAREAFLYLVLFATLYITAFNVGVVLFRLLDVLLPDPTQRWETVRSAAAGARGATAGLVVAFPVFLLVSRGMSRGIEREPEKRGSKIRKWLTYITLFVAAMVLIGDLTFLVSRLLEGELPLRVLLKVLVVFAIAGTVFGHYLGELRRDERDGAVTHRVPPRAAAAAVALVLVTGLILSGSPVRERRIQLDAQRIEDLRSVSRAVNLYVHERGELPPTLDPVMRQPEVGWARFQDPVSRERYVYHALDARRYELCATFDAADSTGTDGTDAFWWHRAGRSCFTFEVPRRDARGDWDREAPVPERGP